MTEQEQKAFDLMREALKLCYEHCRVYHPEVDTNNVGQSVCQAITAANAVSEQQGEAKTYAPSRQRVVMACDILDRIKEAHENWGGWSGTPSSCDAAINLLRYPANMPVNAAHPQATEPAGKTRDPLDLGQYVNEANISANDKPVAVIEKLQAVINVKKAFQ